MLNVTYCVFACDIVKLDRKLNFIAGHLSNEANLLDKPDESSYCLSLSVVTSVIHLFIDVI